MKHALRQFCVLLAAAALGCSGHQATPGATAAVPAAGAPRFHLSERPEQAPGPCSACGRIVLTYLDGPGVDTIDEAYVANLAEQLRTLYRIEVAAGLSSTVPQSAWDSARRQYDGDQIISTLQTSFTGAEPGTTYLALMNEDIFLGHRPEWKWAFAGRRTDTDGGGFAVISAHRMTGAEARRRMLVMVGKYVGAMACGFPTTGDPSSIMFDRVLSAADLDRMGSVACYLSDGVTTP